MTKQEIQDRYEWFLEQVEPYDGFKVEDYYGVQFMKVKRNNTYDLRLQYDYSSRAKNGSAFKIETLEELLDWIIVLEEYAVDKSSVRKIKKYEPRIKEEYNEEEEYF